jgi:hypothetical protein
MSWGEMSWGESVTMGCCESLPPAADTTPDIAVMALAHLGDAKLINQTEEGGGGVLH